VEQGLQTYPRCPVSNNLSHKSIFHSSWSVMSCNHLTRLIILLFCVCIFPVFLSFFMCTCDFTSPITCMDISILYLILINCSYQRLMGALLSGLMWLLLQLRCTVLSRSKINKFLRAGCTFCPPAIIVKTVKGTQYTSRNQWPVSSLFHSYWMNAWMLSLFYYMYNVYLTGLALQRLCHV